jgi:hypothetical protein
MYGSGNNASTLKWFTTFYTYQFTVLGILTQLKPSEGNGGRKFLLKLFLVINIRRQQNGKKNLHFIFA